MTETTRKDVSRSRNQKPVNIALQGGGAHGAFAWGVLDKLLEDGRLDIEAISATSAGAMNAVVMAYGISIGGADGAREKLDEFWKEISRGRRALQSGAARCRGRTGCRPTASSPSSRRRSWRSRR